MEGRLPSEGSSTTSLKDDDGVQDGEGSKLKRVATHPLSKKPEDLRESVKVLKRLPKYSGVYSVGMMEIEIPAEHPRTFSHITRHKRHVLELETVLCTIYYPSAFGSGSGTDPGGRGHWSRATWMPRPRRKMAKGYARFAGAPAYLVEPYLLACVGLTKTRAFRNAHLADHWPPDQNARIAGQNIKNTRGKPPEGGPAQPIFPVMIFSHGLGGNRTTYSSLCGEFASYGFIVVAVEHRDGSGVRTFVNHPSKEWRMSNGVDHLPHEYKEKHDRIDYIWPQGNRADTAPHNEKGVDKELRRAQVSMRKAEIKEVERMLEIIQRGDGKLITEQNLRKKGNIGSSSHGLEGVDWDRWKGRFYLDKITMLGHSFGAATTVAVLRDREMFPNMGQGIIYDIWGGPMVVDSVNKIQTPLLGINSEAFMYWDQNFRIATGIVQEAEQQGALAWLLTVKGTVHLSQSDFQLLFPWLTKILLGATASPRRAIALNVNATLEFLRLVMPIRMSQINRGTDEGVLETSTLSKLPTEHKPKDRWIAMRIGSRTPRDLTRGLSKARQVHRGEYHKEGIGKEIWMHVAPSKSQLEEKGICGRRAPAGSPHKKHVRKHKHSGLPTDSQGLLDTSDRNHDVQPSQNGNISKNTNNIENHNAKDDDHLGDWHGTQQAETTREPREKKGYYWRHPYKLPQHFKTQVRSPRAVVMPLGLVGVSGVAPGAVEGVDTNSSNPA